MKQQIISKEIKIDTEHPEWIRILLELRKENVKRKKEEKYYGKQ